MGLFVMFARVFPGLTHTPRFNVSGTDRDGPNDNCGTVDPGFEWGFDDSQAVLNWVWEPSGSEVQHYP